MGLQRPAHDLVEADAQALRRSRGLAVELGGHAHVEGAAEGPVRLEVALLAEREVVVHGLAEGALERLDRVALVGDEVVDEQDLPVEQPVGEVHLDGSLVAAVAERLRHQSSPRSLRKRASVRTWYAFISPRGCGSCITILDPSGAMEALAEARWRTNPRRSRQHIAFSKRLQLKCSCNPESERERTRPRSRAGVASQRGRVRPSFC